MQIKRKSNLSTPKLPKCNLKTLNTIPKRKLKNNIIIRRKNENINSDLLYLKNKLDIFNTRAKKEKAFDFFDDPFFNSSLFDGIDLKKIRKIYYKKGYFPSEFLNFLKEIQNLGN